MNTFCCAILRDAQTEDGPVTAELLHAHLEAEEAGQAWTTLIQHAAAAAVDLQEGDYTLLRVVVHRQEGSETTVETRTRLTPELLRAYNTIRALRAEPAPSVHPHGDFFSSPPPGVFLH